MAYLKNDPKSVEKINKLKENPDFSGVEFIAVPESQKETFENLTRDGIKIGQDLAKYFEANVSKDNNGPSLSTKIHFVMDTDGYLKKVKPLSNNNEEFAYLSAILLHEMNKKYINAFLITEYVLPVKMNQD